MFARCRRSKSAETGDDTMFTFPISRRQADRSVPRRPRARRPLVEDLEGRRLPSGIVGNHIGTSVVSDVVVMRKAGGNHDTPAIVGNHIGMSVAPAIVGNHIGMSAGGSVRGVSSGSADTVRFFE
jgi:hypothetical protein